MEWTMQSEREEKEVEEVSDKEGSYVLPGQHSVRVPGIFLVAVSKY